MSTYLSTTMEIQQSLEESLLHAAQISAEDKARRAQTLKLRFADTILKAQKSLHEDKARMKQLSSHTTMVANNSSSSTSTSTTAADDIIKKVEKNKDHCKKRPIQEAAAADRNRKRGREAEEKSPVVDDDDQEVQVNEAERLRDMKRQRAEARAALDRMQISHQFVGDDGDKYWEYMEALETFSRRSSNLLSS